MVVWGDNKGSGVVVEGSVERQPRWSLENQHLGLEKGLGSLVGHWRGVKVAPGRLLAMEYQNSIVIRFVARTKGYLH